jgi:S-adenosylmethionine uptake transporter
VALLGERLTLGIVLALLAGFAGMLVIVGGKVGLGTYTTQTVWGAAAVLLSAVTYAAVVVLLRLRAQVDPIPVIVLLQNVLPALLLAPLAAWVWTPLSLEDAGRFLAVGALGVAGHTCLAEAFKRAEAAALAPLHYTVLVWGILWGWVFFREVPGVATLAGAALIVAATVLVQRK